MTTEAISLTTFIPVSPQQLYQAWLNSDEHSRMTGGAATCQPMVGGRFTAWDDYVQGMNVVLEPGKRIVQSWRSADFPQEAEDSRLELVFEAIAGGTMLELRHTEIPEGQGDDYKEGWQEHYFAPMKVYFLTADHQRATTPPNYANHVNGNSAYDASPATEVAARQPVRTVRRTKTVKLATKRGKTTMRKTKKAAKKVVKKAKKTAKRTVKKAKKAVKKVARKAKKKVAKKAAKRRKR